MNPREISQALVRRWKEKMQDSRSSPPQGTGQLPGEGWTWCVGCCPVNPGIPVLREEGGSQQFLVGLSCKSPPSPAWSSFSPRRAWLSGGPWAGSCWGPLLPALGRSGARVEQRREGCPSAGVGDTRHKAGQGVAPTVCSQLVTDKSQGNVKHWAELQELGRASDNPRSEPEKDTQPRLALPGFPWACEHWAPGMAALLVTPPALGLALGTWPFLREAGLGLGPRSPWGMARKALGLSGEGEIPLVHSTVQGLIRNSEHLGGPRIGKEGEASSKLMETWNVSPTNPKPLGGWGQWLCSCSRHQ